MLASPRPRLVLPRGQAAGGRAPLCSVSPPGRHAGRVGGEWRLAKYCYVVHYNYLARAPLGCSATSKSSQQQLDSVIMWYDTDIYDGEVPPR